MHPKIGCRAGETGHGPGAPTGVRGAASGSPVPDWGRLGGAGHPQLDRLVLPSPAHAGGLSLSPQFATGNANVWPGTSIPVSPGFPLLLGRSSPCFPIRAGEKLVVPSCRHRTAALGTPMSRGLPPREQLQSGSHCPRPCVATLLGIVRVREGGRGGETKGRAPSQRPQRGCAGPGASQH